MNDFSVFPLVVHFNWLELLLLPGQSCSSNALLFREADTKLSEIGTSNQSQLIAIKFKF